MGVGLLPHSTGSDSPLLVALLDGEVALFAGCYLGFHPAQRFRLLLQSQSPINLNSSLIYILCHQLGVMIVGSFVHLCLQPWLQDGDNEALRQPSPFLLLSVAPVALARAH